jgi:hypothetical protein
MKLIPELFSHERYSLFITIPTILITVGALEYCITVGWLFYTVGVSWPTDLRMELRKLLNDDF